ncbi:MAG TPA: hypothetical protein DC038_13365, partial [Clostridiales bacterium]|nr:hypothetical protein [Clostridiales bacterium]
MYLPQAAEKARLLRCRSAGQSSRMFGYVPVALLPAPCRTNFFNSLSFSIHTVDNTIHTIYIIII